MAFDGNFMCTSFKKELMEAKHNFLNSGGNTFQLALYTNSATFTAATTAYTTSNEVSGTNYTAKGNSLTRVDPLLILILQTLLGVVQRSQLVEGYCLMILLLVILLV